MAKQHFTVDQIADQLERGFWAYQGTIAHTFKTQNVTVSLVGLTAAGQTLARSALQAWSDVTGFKFTETTSAKASIVFDDNQSGAFSGSSYSGNGSISQSIVNVSTDWLKSYGTTLNSYSYQTYIHEIGHALGLGHAGNYNGSASYAPDALYANDSWQTSVMSYFTQTENPTTNASFAFVVTPQVADIVAMRDMYHWTVATRTGDTVYGFNSNAGAALDAALNPKVAYTVVDSGGHDTLDYSRFSANQLIDLGEEHFSNVGGLMGNVAIGRGTIIEDAIGGSGADRLIGNAAVNVLKGGGGDDTYVIQTIGDKAIEADRGGNDTVEASVSYSLQGQFVETLKLTGTIAIDGTGNTLANAIFGNAAANVIDGKEGVDRLTGGAGRDTFAFTTALAGNIDVIVDFNATDDTIRLENGIFLGMKEGVLAQNAFVVGSAAQDTFDRIIYNQQSGALFFDRDGSASVYKPIQFATIENHSAMTNADFFVV